MHVPAYASDFEMAQNSNHSISIRNITKYGNHVLFFLKWLTFFSSKILRWLKIRSEIEFEAKTILIQKRSHSTDSYLKCILPELHGHYGFLVSFWRPVDLRSKKFHVLVF